jgi:methylated-DNA-[protein]-cysteine S-methyltransferase
MPTAESEVVVNNRPDLSLALAETEAGWIGLVYSPRGLCELRYPLLDADEAMARLHAEFPEAEASPDGAHSDAREQLAAYFAGVPTTFELAFDLEEQTAFRRSVWEVACAIPYGQTRSYSWVARRIESPKAYRAVGSALGANPIPIIIPCHRVLRSDGSLGGYGGGLAFKQRLLNMEKGVAASKVSELT